MKKQDLTDAKTLDIKSLKERAKKLRDEVTDLHMDKNMNKLSDKKVIWKKRKDLAQILTVLKQKELLAIFEPPKGETK